MYKLNVLAYADKCMFPPRLTSLLIIAIVEIVQPKLTMLSLLGCV